MNRSSLIVLYLFFCPMLAVLGQETGWGVFSEEELTLESVSFEPEAKVVSLFEHGKTGLVWEKDTYRILGMYTEYHFRYKLLDDNVRGFGDFVIPYYHAGEWKIENILDLEAQVSYLEDGERKVYQLTQEDIKQLDLGDGQGEYRLIFPKVFKGSILEYRYIKTDRVYYTLEGWVFQGKYPKLKSEFTFEVPGFLQYQLIMPSGRVKSSMTHSTKKDRFSWDMRNLASFRLEPYISSPMDYLERVEGFLAIDATRTPPQLYSTWQSLGDQIMRLKEFSSYDKSVSYKTFGLKEDIFLSESKAAVASKIYDYVSGNFTLEPSLYAFPSKTLSELIRSKKGNHLDIHLLLIAALRRFEIVAEPILVNELSPQSRSFLIPSPNIDQFSSSLVRMVIADDTTYLDATDSRLPFGLIPLRKLVEKGFLLKKERSEIVDLTYDFDSKTDLEVNLGVDSVGNLELREKLTLTDLQVLALLDALAVREDDGAPDKSEPYNVTFEDRFRDENFILTSYHLPVKEANESVILLDPFTFSGFAISPFLEESRIYPLEFGFPMRETMRFNVELPEGYTLDEYPSSVSIRSDLGDLIFVFDTGLEEGILKITADLQINVEKSISRGRYREVRDFFQIVSEKLSEPIVVIRKSDQ